MDLIALCNILRSYQFSIHDEKYLQGEIEDVFKSEGIKYQREVPLSTGIIDFMVGDIGIEIKLKQRPMSVYRQLERYLEDPQVKQIILATVRPIPLPEMINGFPSKSVTIKGGM